MPNWVYNNIAIKGKKENVLNFLNEGLKNSKLKECKTIEGAFNKLLKHAKVATSRSMDFRRKAWGKKANVFLVKGLTLDTFRPMPNTFLHYDTTNHGSKLKSVSAYQRKKYGVVGWYDWGCVYRGTKWDAKIENFKLETDGEFATLSFHCDTAWSCPEGWLRWVKHTFKVNVFLSATEEGDNFNPFYCEIDGNEYDCYEGGEDMPQEDDFEYDDDFYEALYDWREERQDVMYCEFKNYVSEYEVDC